MRLISSKPWVLARDDATLAEVQGICTQGLNIFRTLMIFLAPVIPVVATLSRQFLGEDDWTWEDAASPILGATISTFKPLLLRVDAEQVERMVEASRQ